MSMKERKPLLQGCFLLTCLGFVEVNYSMDFCPPHCHYYFFKYTVYAANQPFRTSLL